MSQSGGQYDMVIDDGGHLMKLQKPSFEVLWDHVMPGGVYFIEDLDVVPAGVVLNPLPLTLYPLNQLSLNTYPLNTHYQHTLTTLPNPPHLLNTYRRRSRGYQP